MDRLANPQTSGAELDFELSLRPKRIEDFVGQSKIKSNLRVFIEAARQRGEHLDHVLLFGPPGLGKTTLANIIANEMESDILVTSGPVMEKAGDLAGILTNMKHRDVLFIDEIHRMNRVVEEYLYPAMEDFSIDILIDKGPNARSIKLDLQKFTLVGATTRAGMITPPMRERFGVIFRFDYYNAEDLYKIVRRSAKILNVDIDREGAFEIARRSRGTPRIANRLLRRVRDFAQIEGNGNIDKEIAEVSLEQLDIDNKGLDEMDKKIISTLIEKFGGGPVGVKNISAAIGEDPGTLEELYEPYLIKEGFIKRTLRGREATHLAYEHFGFKPRNAERTLL